MRDLQRQINDMHRAVNVRFEQYLAVRVNPQPRWCPFWMWKRLLALTVRVEVGPPQFRFEDGGLLP